MLSLLFAATGGGVQRVNVQLANGLLNCGFQVECVMPQAVGPFLPDLAPEVRVVSLDTRSPSSVVLRLSRYLDLKQPDAIIAAQHHINAATLLARRLSCSRPPVLAVQHNTLSALAAQSRRATVRFLMPRLAGWTFKWAEHLAGVSSGVANDLANLTGLAPERIHVLPNPVIRPDCAEHASRPSGHPWLDAKDRPVIVAVGNLIPFKDFGTLLRAFARIRAERPARLVILGEGSERDRLEHLAADLGIAEDTVLPGFVPNVLAFLARADLLASSSRVEGLPTVLIEALACGCPVVATDCPSGSAEILAGGRYGQLVPMGDAEGLARAVHTALDSPCDAALLRSRANFYTEAASVARYARLLESMITQDRTSQDTGVGIGEGLRPSYGTPRFQAIERAMPFNDSLG